MILFNFLNIFKSLFFQSWIDLAKQYDRINYPTLIISVSVFFVLIVFKEFLEHPIRRKLKIDFQIPIDLLVIIVSTAIGSQLKWEETYKVRIMNSIPVGLPMYVIEFGNKDDFNLLILFTF